LNLLLDTNIWLWALYEPERVSVDLRSHIENPDHTVYFSAISVWEFMIKRQIGKLPLQGDPVFQSLTHGFTELSFDSRHAASTASLPMHHRDPFDRAIIAQAKAERLTLCTSDAKLRAYDAEVKLHFA